MAKLFLTVTSCLFLANIVWAQPIETNSPANAMLDIILLNNQNNQPNVHREESTPYSHESERNNSLARAVLAIQGVKLNLRFDKNSKVDFSRDTAINEKEKHNSLFHGALSK